MRGILIDLINNSEDIAIERMIGDGLVVSDKIRIPFGSVPNIKVEKMKTYLIGRDFNVKIISEPILVKGKLNYICYLEVTR